MATSAEIRAGFEILKATAEAIRDAGQVPAGHLYAMLCGHLSIGGFESLISTLVNADLVKRNGDMLVWIAPRAEGGAA
jgi:hypothetical protein